MEEMQQEEEWVIMSEAARILRVGIGKLSKMARRKEIKTKTNPRDDRVTLVDLVQLRKIFP